jgi:hypothetical protein
VTNVALRTLPLETCSAVSAAIDVPGGDAKRELSWFPPHQEGYTGEVRHVGALLENEDSEGCTALGVLV